MSAANPHWNGLRGPEPTLPSAYYFDATHYQRELERIWRRNWIYVGRSDALPEPRSFQTVALATQSILLLRDDQGVLRAYHNTCRHRGAVLCTDRSGRLAGGSITCRYHAFSYGLDGRFLRRALHGRSLPADGTEGLALYELGVREWRGFVFVNLSAAPLAEPEQFFAADALALRNWPLERLVVAHEQERVVHSNWKVLWDNYNECLHCPSVHPALSRLVPIYRRGIMEPQDDAECSQHSERPEPEYRGGLRAGAATWSTDGRAIGPPFTALSAQERELGYCYLSFPPSLYLVAHVDYVRSVRYLPQGPEHTAVRVQWLVAPEARAQPDFNMQPAVEFVNQVMGEDAAVCELTQQGLHSIAHEAGVLMPEEYDVYRFQNWVRGELAR